MKRIRWTFHALKNLVDREIDRAEAEKTLAPFYQKRLTPFPPEPVRWLGYQVITRVTGKSPRKRA